MPTTTARKSEAKKAAKPAAARRAKPRALTKAEHDAWWARQDEQTKELIRNIQMLKGVI